MATGFALLALAICAGTAAARNFHCAGGIQYVIQGTKEKDKGNLEDAHRIFGKGVAQLRQCTTEDPNDSEAWSYLGWALAEVDSAAEAGAAFDEAEKRLVGNTKALTIATQNRKSYWVNYYNDGLSKYKSADSIMAVKEILDLDRSQGRRRAGRGSRCRRPRSARRLRSRRRRWAPTTTSRSCSRCRASFPRPTR
jgi:tetratricopeptide (TPR) repeat protein